MNGIELLKGRRSVRKFKDEKIDHKLMEEIIDIARWAPTWGNSQVARYTIINDKNIIDKLATEGVQGFVYNIDTLKKASNVVVLSFVKGKSGSLKGYDVEKSGEMVWEIFDAGISCQTFCLAAHAKGIGSCIMGVINEKSIASIVNLPQEESVAALIVIGYPEGETKIPPRLEAKDVMRFI